MSKTMLKIENVSKVYTLGQIGGTTLRDELQRFNAKLHHKDDPTKKISAKKINIGEKFKAIDNISFSVQEGERIGIIGHNGAGKSTLLKLISRITVPTEGSISMNGRVASMLEVGTGFHPELTGRENIYMNGAILGMTKKEIDSKIEDIIEFSECRQFIDTPVKRYSSGMYVKLAFSVAAHLDSEILIMDEVLAVGDMAFQNKCIEKMNDISKKTGRTILYVSHNMNTIRQLCNRCLVLNQGQLVFDGNVETGIEKYMGLNIRPSTSFDFESYYRSPNESRKLEMLGINIINSKNGIFQRGDCIELILHCRANCDVENIGIRFECFVTKNVVGTMFGTRKIKGKKGQNIDVNIKIKTSNFVPAVYSCVSLLYEDGLYGTQYAIDRVDPALVFEIVDESNTLTWLPQYWGYIRLDDMQIQQ